MTNQQETFYITTPIYYPSGRLHIGNAYSTLAADAGARYNRLIGKDVYFLTGTDEHGQKIEESASELGLDPQTYVDQMASQYKELWDLLDISYDGFIRTTDENHKKAVQAIFNQLLEQDDIYLGEYEGWYSVSDEEFFTESQLQEVFRDDQGNVTGGIAPSGHEVERVKETSYFFRLSKYADQLLDYYNSHPDFIVPEFRKTEMINTFLKPGLEDLAVTRTSFDWGIPVESDPEHVVYVWIDALSNYITHLGYGSDDTTLFDRYWPANFQIVGKDITRFHTIYWPIMLMALGLELPKTIYAHGWYVMKDGKMSKSRGNAIYPETLVERYGLDATRYYLLREMNKGQDTTFTPEDFVNRVNFELANDLGNLLNRTIAMINQYFEGKVITDVTERRPTAFDSELEAFMTKEYQSYHDAMARLAYDRALEHLMHIVSRTNKYIDETTPWILAREEDKRAELASVMYHLVDSLRMVAHGLRPFMTQVPGKMFDQLGLSDEEERLIDEVEIGQIPEGTTVVKKGTPIFPRLDVEKEVEYIASQMKPEEEVFEPEETELAYEKTEAVEFDQFVETELKVAEVIDVTPVEGSTRLLNFRLNAGDKGHRQILSGIAESYPDPSELIGQKVAIVANLKPRKMMGLISQGMILSTETPEGLRVVTVDPESVVGTLIS